jgi:hypothetical protein
MAPTSRRCWACRPAQVNKSTYGPVDMRTVRPARVRRALRARAALRAGPPLPISTIVMDSWNRGRVTLVKDAGDLRLEDARTSSTTMGLSSRPRTGRSCDPPSKQLQILSTTL